VERPDSHVCARLAKKEREQTPCVLMPVKQWQASAQNQQAQLERRAALAVSAPAPSQAGTDEFSSGALVNQNLMETIDESLRCALACCRTHVDRLYRRSR